MPDSLLEKIYYRLPVPVQNGIFSLYGLKQSRTRYNAHFDDYLHNLKRSEWWSDSQIHAYQDKRISDIVAHAYATVPFYRKWYDEHGVDVGSINSRVDLRRLPVLTKQVVRENQDDLVSDAFSGRALHTNLTSGTTGTPLSIQKTGKGVAFQWAVWWRHKARFGLSRHDRELTFGARIPLAEGRSKPPFWRNDTFNKRVYLSTYHISAETVRHIVDYLNKEQFDFFSGYPSAMYVLANLIEESELRVYNRPKYIVTGSDALLPKYESVIRRVFGAQITEQYGMAEFAGNMSKCEYGRFHEDFECCHVEQAEGHDGGPSPLILTGWGNRAMPFIRYEVGDMGTLYEGTCECGRESACYKSIDGRLEDFILTPDGRKLTGMNQVLEYATHAKEIQIYQQRPDEVTFRIVPGAEFNDRDKEALLREFRRRGGRDMEVRFVLVDELERSSSGKVQAVISDVAPVDASV